ncbi:MiaB-like tRNA modifying enzyme [Butyrivibrio proteoclasticus B316]|uniref:Ribosomal protein uS12 methylthiotransferase RimO n=1 Tax=Butyrivibrio proteoclasticus (strain ATCC 51982 / DSM 14932 / B316) TaxID=515622 RepID=E0S2Q5_BUTPB|nr:30S ribosomal protein S12 methylthiotransferase RimO [Butyrivibrio proteoclasticus]ADL34022.1 MiaB-like tRNA modifying enzyme [Butyrivibrio proteoclasticus B316]
MKILFVSLGCDKNRVDTEVMLGMLADRGHNFTDDEQEAEAAVVNTCCFINDAKEESINTILELAERRKSGQLKALIVTGCLAQRYKEEIQDEIPEVDEILGVSSTDKIIEALDETIERNKLFSHKNYFDDVNRKPIGGKKRVITTGGLYNYLKIAEGCDKHCTYCIIPKVRGAYRSVPMEQLLADARNLAEAGVTELLLVAQETTLYGTDLYGEKKLPELLHKLCEIDGFKWIRILYCYPEEITEELIQTIKTEPKICHYLDIPIQSGSDRILKLMGRRTNNAEIRALVEHLREEIPDICIRTTLISGFPGETAADHNETFKLVEDLRFDRLGVFTYSQEEDTPAATMPDQVTERVKNTRRNKLMRLQQEIAFENAENMVGKIVEAVIEGRITDTDDEEGFSYVARTYKDAPDIDGYVFVTGVKRELMTGDYIKVLITGSNEYDLIGEETT